MAVIYPTMLAFDPLNAEREMTKIEPLAEGFQLDIMDNHFVPNITYGADFVNAFSRLTYKKIWVHLMVNSPANWIGRLTVPFESIISFHPEATGSISQTIEFIKDKNWLPSLAVNPETDIEAIFPFLPNIYQVSLMAVKPGFPGQLFIKSTFDKLKKLKGYRQTSGLKFRIAVDGGIKKENIENVILEGADDIAIASAIFGSEDPVKELQDFINIRDTVLKGI